MSVLQHAPTGLISLPRDGSCSRVTGNMQGGILITSERFKNRDEKIPELEECVLLRNREEELRGAGSPGFRFIWTAGGFTTSSTLIIVNEFVLAPRRPVIKQHHVSNPANTRRA